MAQIWLFFSWMFPVLKMKSRDWTSVWSQSCENTHCSPYRTCDDTLWAGFLRRAGQRNICGRSVSSYQSLCFYSSPSAFLCEASAHSKDALTWFCIWPVGLNWMRWHKAAQEKNTQNIKSDESKSKQTSQSQSWPLFCSSPGLIKVDCSLRVSTVRCGHPQR